MNIPHDVSITFQTVFYVVSISKYSLKSSKDTPFKMVYSEMKFFYEVHVFSLFSDVILSISCNS